MTNEQINIAIAEARGIVGPFENRWIKELEMDGGLTGYETYGLTGFIKNELVFVADSCNDLNAMHEAEKSLAHDIRNRYIDLLGETYSDSWEFATATARQRAEAFLKTIGKWESL